MGGTPQRALRPPRTRTRKKYKWFWTRLCGNWARGPTTKTLLRRSEIENRRHESATRATQADNEQVHDWEEHRSDGETSEAEALEAPAYGGADLANSDNHPQRPLQDLERIEWEINFSAAGGEVPLAFGQPDLDDEPDWDDQRGAPREAPDGSTSHRGSISTQAMGEALARAEAQDNAWARLCQRHAPTGKGRDSNIARGLLRRLREKVVAAQQHWKSLL